MAGKRLTKSQLVAELSEKWGVSKKQTGEMWDGMLALLYSEVKRAGEVVLPGLGKLAKKARAARMGRNPATGATISIPAKTVLKFGVGKACKEALL
jgi:DNA-binding protein HU-beta